jgi:hypothetical protein
MIPQPHKRPITALIGLKQPRTVRSGMAVLNISAARQPKTSQSRKGKGGTKPGGCGHCRPTGVW